MLLKSSTANKATMEIIFKQRAIQRASDKFYKKYFGIEPVELELKGEPTPDDLIFATKRAQYARILDILDNDVDSVTPNDVNEEGESAFYIALMLVLDNETSEAGADLLMELTLWERFKLRFSKKQKSMKLDLIVQVLLYK